MPWQCGTYNAAVNCPFTSTSAVSVFHGDDVTDNPEVYAGLADEPSQFVVDASNDSSLSSWPLLFFASPSNLSSMPGTDTSRQSTVTQLRRLQSDASSTTSGSDVDLVDINSFIEFYVIGVLVVFGLLANGASVIVLRRYRERRDALFLLQALAVADGLYLTVAGLRYPLKYVLTPGTGNVDRYVQMQPIVFPLLKTFQVRLTS
jgi:hypothetical protein